MGSLCFVRNCSLRPYLFYFSCSATSGDEGSVGLLSIAGTENSRWEEYGTGACVQYE